MPTPQSTSAWKPVDESSANAWTPVPDTSTPAMTANPNGEGTYKMSSSDGQQIGIPFSKVNDALTKGYQIDAGDRDRFLKDQDYGKAPSTNLEKLAGVHPLYDTASTVGTHLKNLVAGPYHAFTDAPTDEEETQEAVTGGVGANPISRGLHRMLISPTETGLQTFNAQRKAGNTSVTAPEYDANGNYTPTAVSGLMDAIPLAGPWARSIDNDAHKKGALAALAGLGTDVAGPKIIGKGLSAALPAASKGLVSTALRLRAPDRAFGATPEQFVLDRTSGFSPEDVTASARKSLKGLQAEQSNVLGAAPGDVPLTPTRGIGNNYFDRALEENHPGTLKDIGKLTKQLAFRIDEAGNFDDQSPIADTVRPAEAAALNRGLASAKTSWNPATASDTMNAAAGEMHHQLATNIADVVPEVKPINQQVQSGIPIVQRGTAAALDADTLQRTLGRVAAHTGALTGLVEGFRHGGPVGAAAGLVIPELIANPDMQIAAARGLHALTPIAANAAPAFTAASAVTQPKPSMFFAPPQTLPPSKPKNKR